MVNEEIQEADGRKIHKAADTQTSHCVLLPMRIRYCCCDGQGPSTRMTQTSDKQKSATATTMMMMLMMTLGVVFVVTIVFLIQVPSLLFSVCRDDGSSILVTAVQQPQSTSSRRLLRLVIVSRQQQQQHQPQQQQQPQQHSSLLTLQESIDKIRKAGFDLCLDLKANSQNHQHDVDVLNLFQHCTDNSVETPTSISLLDRPRRRLALEDDENNDSAENEENSEESPEDLLFNIIGALICVSMAALAAGLTLGLLGLDPLLLLIKQRASENEKERIAAADLLPIVKDHHRLLVTLLLLNSVSNEALPIFLEGLHLAPWVAIMISVTLVLFFGEIFPSAIFTGPHQMTIAHSLLPLVKAAMFILYPLAMPIAHLLDRWLHHDGGGGDGDEDQHDSDAYYNRGELSAMIRILYEERLEAKRRRKEHRREVQRLQEQRDGFLFKGDRVGALDFTRNSIRSVDHRDSKRAAISQFEHTAEHHNIMDHHAHRPTIIRSSSIASTDSDGDESYELGAASNSIYEQPDVMRSNSIHLDEVMMVQGALQMKTKVALDVITPWRHVYCIPDTTILSERTIVNIYASGYSRIPVYNAEIGKTAIIGVFITKQLIVLNPNDERPITSMPLYTPLCISPDTSLVDVLNIFQTGGSRAMKGGHMALVCARPREGNEALSSSQHHGATAAAAAASSGDDSANVALLRPKGLPKEAGFMGVITLEDVIEALLQEQIYDEYDKIERDARTRLAEMAITRWRRFVRKSKRLRRGASSNRSTPTTAGSTLLTVVEQAMTEAAFCQSNPNTDAAVAADETTSLLANQKGPPTI